MQVDLVTPMCTQLTYEGLIDEVFGIKNGVVQLELGADGALQCYALWGQGLSCIGGYSFFLHGLDLMHVSHW